MGMRCAIVWLACVIVGASPPASAADLTRVDRSIGKEPAYKTKTPRYCLLVFGPRADYRVWLVLDGGTLRVDRDADGDLTEAGESTTPEAADTDPASFKPITILRPDGKSEEKLEFVLSGWFDYRKGEPLPEFSPWVFVLWGGRWFGSWGDETGPCVWGTTPQDAPVLHAGGPLQMGFETRAEYALKRTGDGVYELSVGVGTRGLGKGAFVHLSYAKDAIPTDVYPTAELEFPSKTPGGPPVRVRAVLKKRC